MNQHDKEAIRPYLLTAANGALIMGLGYILDSEIVSAIGVGAVSVGIALTVSHFEFPELSIQAEEYPPEDEPKLKENPEFPIREE